jgi:ABC-type multidrug transport system ATPase subunit
VRAPRLLLADDPTSGLDPLQQEEVVGLLRTAAAETGVAILITVSAMSALAGTHEAFILSDGGLERVHDPTPAGRVIDFPAGGQMA